MPGTKSFKTLAGSAFTALAMTATMLAAHTAEAEPAEAFPNVRVCVGAPLTPKQAPRGILCEGKVRCVGWNSGNRIESKVWCEERYGIDSNNRWVLAERYSSAYGVGGKNGYWVTRNTNADQRMRTCVSAEVIGSNGLVIKRYGKTCSGAKTL